MDTRKVTNVKDFEEKTGIKGLKQKIQDKLTSVKDKKTEKQDQDDDEDEFLARQTMWEEKKRR